MSRLRWTEHGLPATLQLSVLFLSGIYFRFFKLSRKVVIVGDVYVTYRKEMAAHLPMLPAEPLSWTHKENDHV